jgi:hypothetical protein
VRDRTNNSLHDGSCLTHVYKLQRQKRRQAVISGNLVGFFEAGNVIVIRFFFVERLEMF